MKIDEALGAVSRLAFDTAPIIYFVEANPTYDSLVSNIIEGRTSVISLSEVLVQRVLLSRQNFRKMKREQSSVSGSSVEGRPSRLRELTAELRELEGKLRLGGGPDKIERQHKQGKLTARERIELLLDQDSYSQEMGLLVAYDQYEGGAPGAGVVTVVGRVREREVVVVANDATVKAGSWWPETIKKILRAQEIAMRSHVPIIYLVDSAGVDLSFRVACFPDNTARRESSITTRSCGVI